tara:strand:+ start:287 stop:553 length:267 start_codon:yes stop_codon:yes gene_type:complete
MQLKTNELSNQQYESFISEVMRWAEYKEFQDEVKFLMHGLWLDRTTRWSNVEMNKQILENSKIKIESFKEHLDEVFEDISAFQLHEIQ